MQAINNIRLYNRTGGRKDGCSSRAFRCKTGRHGMPGDTFANRALRRDRRESRMEVQFCG